MFTSVSFVAMNTALDGLALRQRVIADNVANIHTPGFLAGRVSFEESLAAAVRDGYPAAAAGSARVDRSLEQTRENGNNVNLDTETLSSIDTMLRYQFATQAINGSFSSLRAAMRTS